MCCKYTTITTYFTFVFNTCGCDCGTVLFKEPTVAKTPSPEATKQTAAPLEPKISPPTGREFVCDMYDCLAVFLCL